MSTVVNFSDKIREKEYRDWCSELSDEGTIRELANKLYDDFVWYESVKLQNKEVGNVFQANVIQSILAYKVLLLNTGKRGLWDKYFNVWESVLEAVDMGNYGNLDS